MKVVEELFEKLDFNKNLMLNSTSDEQRKQLEKIDKEIMEELDKIEVGSIK